MRLMASLRKPLFMKLWEDSPNLWRIIINLGILLKYGTLNNEKLPDKIHLNSSTTLFINSAENRGRALLISNGVTQHRLHTFWAMAVKTFNPDLVIDVGVNYGECIFSTTYPTHTRIIGIEANSQLLEYIERSKEVHPNQSQIALIHAIASNQDNIEQLFYVDEHWSGTSSAAYSPSHQMIKAIPVKSIMIDSLVDMDQSSQKILFKIDVEGYEPYVLEGMKKLINTHSLMIGFIEFNSEMIQKTGYNIDYFLEFLSDHFTVYVYKENDHLVKVAPLRLIELQKMFDTDFIHTDFIVVKNESSLESFSLTVDPY